MEVDPMERPVSNQCSNLPMLYAAANYMSLNFIC